MSVCMELEPTVLLRAVKLGTSKNLTVKRTTLPHKNTYKHTTWTSPNKKTHCHIYNTLINMRWHSHVFVIQFFKEPAVQLTTIQMDSDYYASDHPPPPNAEVKERVELYLYSHSGPSHPLLLLLLTLKPTVGFSLLSNSLPFHPFLTQFSPPSYSHYLHIVFNILNPSFPWSSSNSST
jgi:hypothetical protein